MSCTPGSTMARGCDAPAIPEGTLTRMNRQTERPAGIQDPLSEAITQSLDAEASDGTVHIGPTDSADAVTPKKKAAKGSSKKKGWTRQAVQLPGDERETLSTLKTRAAHLHGPIKKSGLLRVGIHALAQMGDDALATLLRDFDATAAKPENRRKKHG